MPLSVVSMLPALIFDWMFCVHPCIQKFSSPAALRALEDEVESDWGTLKEGTLVLDAQRTTCNKVCACVLEAAQR